MRRKKAPFPSFLRKKGAREPFRQDDRPDEIMSALTHTDAGPAQTPAARGSSLIFDPATDFV